MGPRMVLSSFGRAAPKAASVKSVANEYKKCMMSDEYMQGKGGVKGG